MKTSVRFLVLESDGTAHVLTQDSRQRVRPIIGCSYLGYISRAKAQSIAKRLGCTCILRPKGMVR